MIPLTEQKKRLRSDASKRREAAAAGIDIGRLLLDRFEAVSGTEGLTIVSGYWPIGEEANVMPLLHELGGRGLDMALPVVPERDTPLTFRLWRDTDPMDIGPFGIREPRREAPTVEPDLLLMPLLAFDRTGGRLGYGGGYYDRTLGLLRSRKRVIAVGIAYAAQEYETVPCAETDARLDWIVTEKEAVRASL